MPEHLQLVGDGEARADPIRVIVADDHPSLRRNLRLLLEREGDLEVIAEAGDLEGAIHLVRTHRPRVLVLDLRMPDGSISERIKRVLEHSRRTAIVLVTMHENRAYADQALSAGAAGLVLKDSADLELVDAVRRAARGRKYRSPRLRSA